MSRHFVLAVLPDVLVETGRDCLESEISTALSICFEMAPNTMWSIRWCTKDFYLWLSKTKQRHLSCQFDKLWKFISVNCQGSVTFSQQHGPVAWGVVVPEALLCQEATLSDSPCPWKYFYALTFHAVILLRSNCGILSCRLHWTHSETFNNSRYFRLYRMKTMWFERQFWNRSGLEMDCVCFVQFTNHPWFTPIFLIQFQQCLLATKWQHQTFIDF